VFKYYKLLPFIYCGSIANLKKVRPDHRQ